MADYLGNPKVQYFASGTAEFLAGGKLYSYEAGTLVATATYPTPADANASTNANANPVILDARGEADVVLARSTKLILKDADDNTIWTQDNVGSNLSVGNIEDDSGNTILGFVSVVNSVNYWQVTNSISGGDPLLEVVGTDTNIDAKVTSKGSGTLLIDAGATGSIDLNTTGTGDINLKRDTNVTGTVTASGDVTLSANLTVTGNSTHTGTTTLTGDTTANGDIDIVSDKTLKMDSKDVLIPATASQQGEIRLYEDTDNGTNYMGIKAPAAVTTSTTLTLPDGDGTANQGLITDASGNLSWADVGGWTLIESQTAASSATIDFTSGITSAYDNYKVVLTKVILSTTTGNLGVRTSTNNGSTFRTAASDYYHNSTSFGSGTTYAAASTTSMLISSSTHTGPVSGYFKFYNPSATTGVHLVGQLSFLSGSVYNTVVCSGQDRISGAVDAIRLLPDAGNFTSGTFSLYGIKI